MTRSNWTTDALSVVFTHLLFNHFFRNDETSMGFSKPRNFPLSQVRRSPSGFRRTDQLCEIIDSGHFESVAPHRLRNRRKWAILKVPLILRISAPWYQPDDPLWVPGVRLLQTQAERALGAGHLKRREATGLHFVRWPPLAWWREEVNVQGGE